MLWIGGFSILKRAPVNKIIPFSNVDGPGNRTAVFFQGCPFNCLFCHNPETIHLCSSCGECISGCPVGALKKNDEGRVEWNKSICVQCDACIKKCRHNASPKVSWMSVDELMAEISRSLSYITGITTSGGECTLHAGFLTDFFTEVKKTGKTCLIDSNGSYDFEKDPALTAMCDGVMLDVKAVEPEWNEKLISHPADMVLKNLDHLLEVGKLFEVRTVIFPDRDKENAETVRYVAQHIGDKCPYKIIRYRPFGVREQYLKTLGGEETGLSYAQRFVDLAREAGALNAYVI